jgi:lysophospholipase L1-like esterase
MIASERAQRLRRLLKTAFLNLVLLLTSLVAALGAGELVVRKAAPQQLILLRPDMWQPADSIGWLPHANVRTTVNTGEGTVQYITDGESFRVSKSGRVEADTEILLLGDSFMEALQVEYEESLAGLIEAHALEAFGRRVAVRNAAVSGWDPPQYRMRARRLLENKRYAAVVVAVFTGNDIINRPMKYVPPRAPARRASLRLPTHLSRRELNASLAQPLNDFLEVRSHLFVFLKTKLRWIAVRSRLVDAYFPQVMLRQERESVRWKVTTDILAELAALARDKGIPILFLLLPNSLQVQQEKLDGVLVELGLDPASVDADQPNRLLGQRLTERGLLTLDALPYLRAAAGKGPSLYGQVDAHLSGPGHEVLWAAIQPSLTQMLRPDRGRAVR